MMRFKPTKKISIVLSLLFWVSPVLAEELISSQCDPLIETDVLAYPESYTEGLLWKISRHDNEDSYVYGTIHLSDIEVTTLPDEVNRALNDSEHFVMEAVPDVEQMMSLSRMMFFSDDRQLSDYVEPAIYKRVESIMSAYMVTPDSLASMKPWAAFLMMNYPPDQGAALDLVLLSLAQQNGASVAGLESLQEQGEIFNQLGIDEQVELLVDTVCHYDVVKKDFSVMKSLYLKRDLGGLYSHANRFVMEDKPVYKKLVNMLITERNITMVDRMQPMLEKGNTFIAIGAMHLTGDDGVLALLEKQGYNVSAIF